MSVNFDNTLFESWCLLYIQHVDKNHQHLAACINNCAAEKMQELMLSAVIDIQIINEIIDSNDYLVSDRKNRKNNSQKIYSPLKMLVSLKSFLPYLHFT